MNQSIILKKVFQQRSGPIPTSKREDDREKHDLHSRPAQRVSQTFFTQETRTFWPIREYPENKHELQQKAWGAKRQYHLCLPTAGCNGCFLYQSIKDKRLQTEGFFGNEQILHPISFGKAMQEEQLCLFPRAPHAFPQRGPC